MCGTTKRDRWPRTQVVSYHLVVLAAWWSRGWRHEGATPGSPRVWIELAAFAILIVGVLRMLAPMLERWDTYGFHDWDSATQFRYITKLSLLRYGELPWWNPYLCGGVPAFGYVEGATNLLSPYLPVYLWSDIRTAIRVEVLGSTLVGLWGAYLLARRFTASVALSALAAALFVLNGRWSLQLATGHTWHLQFCWMPWAFYWFERAQADGRLGRAVWAGGSIALMGCLGGIYPMPYTALTLSVYALLLAGLRWTLRPLLALAITGAVAFGLSAPKLLAAMDGMSQAPRLIESTEVIGPRQLLVMLTDTSQRYGTFPVRVPAYNWHEWGIYIGAPALVLLAIGWIFARGPREWALKILGLLLLLLGFGAFHRLAPWALLHRAPIFSSLHVPSRFHFVMVLVLSLALVAWAARWVDGWVRNRPWLDLALLAPLVLLVADLTHVAQRPIAQAFWMEAPESLPVPGAFVHRTHSTIRYVRRDWAPEVLLPSMINEGVIRCYGVPNTLRVGAIASDAPAYPGMAYVVGEPARARITEWSPNRAVVHIEGATPNALVVYNMNYDPSWHADGRQALAYHDQVAARVAPGTSSVVFRYFPRTLWVSVPLFLLTLGVGFVWPWWRRVMSRCP